MLIKKLVAFILSGTIGLLGLSFVVEQNINHLTSANAIDESEELIVWDQSKDTSWYDDEETEFHINTAEQLAGLIRLSLDLKKDFNGKTVFLENDIYLNKTNVQKTGIDETTRYWTPIGNFKGTFDGNNHNIYNLYSVNGGLFGDYAETVKNINLISAYIKTSNVKIFGICNNANTITNCYFDGIIEPTSTSRQTIGGICVSSHSISGCTSHFYLVYDNKKVYSKTNGDICGGICYSADNINNCFNTYTIRDSPYVQVGNTFAGICVKCTNGSITNCANLSEIQSCNGKGTIAGICTTMDSGVISNCYNIGLVPCIKQGCGGIVGSIDGSVEMNNVYSTGANICGYISLGTLTATNVYYDSSNGSSGIHNKSDPEGIVAKSPAKMKTQEFAESLGDAFMYVVDDFPRLICENDNPHLTHYPIITTTTTSTTQPTTTTKPTTTTTTQTTTTTTTTKPTTTTTTQTTTTTTTTTKPTTTTTTQTTTTTTTTTKPTTTTTTQPTTTTKPTTTTTYKTTTISTTLTTTTNRLELNTEVLTLSVGEQFAIKANQTEVTFRSSNSEITTVGKTSGIITAISEGYSTIFATNADGDTLMIKVTVVNNTNTYGDANCDNKVSIADAVAILQHLGNRDKYGLKSQGISNADVDGIAGVTAKDAFIIQQVDAGIYKPTDLPLRA